MSSAELVDVRRTYRVGDTEVHAVDSVSLVIQSGELVAIMGASGSGKTTLLNLMGGLDRADSGAVYVLGHALAEMSEADLARLRLASVGFVFQELNLLPELTAEENVALPLEGVGISRAVARASASAALARVGLDGLGRRFPDELSGGQQQRVAIARAVVGSRELVLADEPTGSLDTGTGTEIMQLLRGLCDVGATVIVSTHNPLVAGMADRVVEMADGRIVTYAGVAE